MTDVRFEQKDNVRCEEAVAAASAAPGSSSTNGPLTQAGAGDTVVSIVPFTPVPIVVVHPLPLVRSAWKQLLDSQPEFAVAAELSELAEFATVSGPLDTAQRPLVALIDLDSGSGSAPDMSSIAKLRSKVPMARLITITHCEHDSCVMQALRLGVQGFVAKGVSAERLFEAVRMVSSGGSFIDIGEHRSSMSTTAPPPDGPTPPRPELSRREADVLVLVAQGKTNDAVGKEMFISASTVKYHLNNVFQKLQATNRTDAVRIALRLGLVSEEPTNPP